MGIDVTKHLGFREEIMTVNMAPLEGQEYHVSCGVILPWLTLGKRIGDQ